ncbi:phosphoribosyltransferase [Granulosicoccaceae sp. 1_MG-2023]|nr:phosphoribosyltransferase [Granulosicoccaceae sp. 1_MG-2023]
MTLATHNPRSITPEAAAAALGKYRTLNEKSFMSMAEAEALSAALADAVTAAGIRPDKIIGVANGALMPATLVAERLGMPVEMVRIRRKGSAIKRRLSKLPGLRALVTTLYRIPGTHQLLRFVMNRFNRLEEADLDAVLPDKTGTTVLVVDDAIETGQTLKRILDLQQEQNPGARIVNAVISWSIGYREKGQCVVTPDVYLCDRIHHYPWSQNSPEFTDYQQWLGARGLQEWD